MLNKKQLSIGCLIMAAGDSKRFGANKLTTEVSGKALILHAFDAVPADRLHRICVVTQYDEIESLAGKYGFLCVRNHHPEDGISLSIRLGTKELMNTCDAIIYMVSDQPHLSRESVSKILDLYLEHPDNIIGASYNGKRGNPCIFPKKYFPELLKLTGDTGGSRVIRSHEDALLLCEVREEELRDVDTREDLI